MDQLNVNQRVQVRNLTKPESQGGWLRGMESLMGGYGKVIDPMPDKPYVKIQMDNGCIRCFFPHQLYKIG